MVGRHRLIRLIRERKPQILAVDNIYELAPDRPALLSLLAELPISMNLVQVTGGEHPEPLSAIAGRHGISFDRLDPMSEAKACAMLASIGVGDVVLAFEDRTMIKVSRRRSPGRGGWSANRYRRKIHGNVRSLSRDVESRLLDAALPFTARISEGLGGYIRCEFIVEAARERVPIRPGYREDAQIKVEAIQRQKLQWKPLMERRGYIIVGIDPGTTTGLAALDLQGRLIDLVSSRAMTPGDVVSWISSRGKPLIVATDVLPAPDSVEKVKRAFSAVLFSPGYELSEDEKTTLGRQFGYKNDHERDALAAAISAFKKYRNKFKQIDKKAGLGLDLDEVKALVVRGCSIEGAVFMLSTKTEAQETKQVAQPSIKPHDSALHAPDRKSEERHQAEQIKTLRSYLEDLRHELSAKDEEIDSLRRKLDKLKDSTSLKIKRDHEIKIRDKEISRLSSMLKAERKALRRMKSEMASARKVQRIEEISGYRRLKPIEAFSRDAILAAKGKWTIGEDDVVLLLDGAGGGPKSADLLVETGIKAVIVEGDIPQGTLELLNDRHLPVFRSSDLSLSRIDGIVFIDPAVLEEALHSWEGSLKVLEAEKKEKWLEGLIGEYRAMRRREERMAEKLKKAKSK
jgi:predicted RNase H-like nuclease (RuvC/YqgF family)